MQPGVVCMSDPASSSPTHPAVTWINNIKSVALDEPLIEVVTTYTTLKHIHFRLQKSASKHSVQTVQLLRSSFENNISNKHVAKLSSRLLDISHTHTYTHTGRLVEDKILILLHHVKAELQKQRSVIKRVFFFFFHAWIYELWEQTLHFTRSPPWFPLWRGKHMSYN